MADDDPKENDDSLPDSLEGFDLPDGQEPAVEEDQTPPPQDEIPAAPEPPAENASADEPLDVSEDEAAEEQSIEAASEEPPGDEIDDFALPEDDGSGPPLDPVAEIGEEGPAGAPETEAPTFEPSSSNANLIAAIVVVGVAILGVLGYVLFKPGAAKTEAPLDTAAPAPADAGPPKLTKAEQAAALVSQLDTEDFEQSETAQAALVKLGRDAVQPLAKALTSGSQNLRTNAIVTLGKIKAPESLAPLTRALSSDPVPEIRTAAAGALAQLSDLGALDALLQALLDKDEDVQFAADEALQALTGNFSLTSEVETDDPKEIQKIWQGWLAKNKARLVAEHSGVATQKAVPMHVHVWRSGNRPPTATLHPIEGLPGGGLHGQEGSHALVRYLSTLDIPTLITAVKEHSQWMLREIKADQPAECLKRLAAGKDGLAQYARARLDNEQAKKIDQYAAASPEAKKKIESDVIFYIKDRVRKGDPAIRGNAALALGAKKATAASGLLTDMAKNDPDPSMRVCAAIALKDMGQTDTAKATLLALLADTKVYAPTRGLAAYALGQMKAKEAIAPLIAAVNTTDDDLRNRSHEALMAITGCTTIKPEETGSPQALQAKWQEWCDAHK